MAGHSEASSNANPGAPLKQSVQTTVSANANGSRETDPLIVRDGSGTVPQGYTVTTSTSSQENSSREQDENKSASGLGKAFEDAKLSTLRFCEKGWPFLIVLLFVGVFIGLLAWFDVFYECVVPFDAETVSVNQTIDASDYKDLYFHLDTGITGDVQLSQTRNWREKDIQISMSMRASSPEMLKYLVADLRLDVQQLTPRPRSMGGGRAESFIFINMTSSDLKRALSRNCTQVMVNIVLPRDLEKFNSIEVQSTSGGSISVKTDDLKLRDKLILSTTGGDISVKDISVRRETKLKTSNGRVVADNLGAERLVEIEATDGVEVELSGVNDELDANIYAGSDMNIVTLAQSFYGHFKLTASSSLPEIYSSRCCIYYHEFGNHTAAGYITNTQYEPGRLPRIKMRGSSTELRVRN